MRGITCSLPLTPEQAYDRLCAALLYIGWVGRGKSLGLVRINKILWFADCASHMMAMAPMIGCQFVKGKFGPVSSLAQDAIQSLAEAGKVKSGYETRTGFYESYSEFTLETLEEPDISVFSDEEKMLLHSLIDIIQTKYSASAISEISHDALWEDAFLGQEMSPAAEASISMSKVSPNPDDIAWALEACEA